MPYCPTCRHAFPEETTECPTCSAALVDELPYQTIDSPTSTWVEIATAATVDEARILQGFLEAEGISCQLESLRFNEAPVNVGTMAEIRVYVSAEDQQDALKLLDERQREYDSLRDEETVITDEGPAAIDDDAQTVAETDEK